MDRVPWLALGLLAAAGILWAGGPALGVLAFPCPFKGVTGLPCAGCGLTRCALALARGRWAEAVHWHPAALLVPLAPLAAGWDLLRALRGRPWPGLPEAPWVRWGAWALLLGVWAWQAARGI